MEKLIPNNFIEALGGSIIALAIILSLISLVPGLRSHSIRLLALFIVAALALFSNHWTTYFAGIFVIATAVTELEFLQNLAAIIRGNKDYFDYKKETLSTEQKQKKIEEEQAQIAQQDTEELVAADTKTVKTFRASITPTPPDIQKILNIEEKALDKMEEYYKTKIERGVSISRKGRRIQLDGLIPSEVDDMVSEKIIEVKYLRSPTHFVTIEHLFPKLESISRAYCEITNKIAKLHIVLVIEGEEELNERQHSTLKRLVDSSNIAMGYSVFTTKQLGLNGAT